MTRKNFLRTAFALAMAMLTIGFTAGVGTAKAQCPGCPGVAPGAGYWVNYNYVYPPAPNGALTLDLAFASGWVDITNELADGHYTYSQSPAWGPANTLKVSWAGGGATFPVPCPKTPVTTPWGILNVEIKCNPCIEIDVSY
ncbi:MAG: hypothetical protein JST22_09335 [Bacteroidetes bacterium]|nr:hypothetical protein [Bacteroidota bacterium]